jgi:hypothetical protein
VIFTWLERKLRKPAPTAGLRLYEWRLGTGQRYHEPRLAVNACAFYARGLAEGIVRVPMPFSAADARTSNAGPVFELWIHVVLTGERVLAQPSDCRTKVRLDAEMPWFNADGRQVA